MDGYSGSISAFSGTRRTIHSSIITLGVIDASCQTRLSVPGSSLRFIDHFLLWADVSEPTDCCRSHDQCLQANKPYIRRGFLTRGIDWGVGYRLPTRPTRSGFCSTSIAKAALFGGVLHPRNTHYTCHISVRHHRCSIPNSTFSESVQPPLCWTLLIVERSPSISKAGCFSAVGTQAGTSARIISVAINFSKKASFVEEPSPAASLGV